MNVDLLQNIYGNSLEENEKNILFWEKRIQELVALDLNRYVQKLTVPILVPIGSRILFRGELKHTNEVTVALGADYFAKCSVEQAHLLIKHRIEVAQSKLDKLRTEKDFLQKHLSLSEKTLTEESGTDIVEFVSEEEDKNWRKQHRENVRKYKQRKVNNNEMPANEMSNEQLWSRLEELELQEELDNEIQKDDVDVSKPAAEIGREDSKNIIEIRDREQLNTDDSSDDESENENVIYLPHHRRSIFQQPSKLQLFEQVIKRHKALKKMVAQIRARQARLVTEEDIIRRVGEMERLEVLEDEIGILEDMLESDDDDIEEGEEDDSADKQEKKSVAFADDDDCDTFEITFTHSEVEPSSEPYDPQKGIIKPSDIHQAYAGCFSGETTSILKKSKYVSPETSQTKPVVEENPEKEDVKEDSNLNRTIVVRDVVEKTDCNDKNANQNGRPMSLFKKRRQQLKE